MKNNLTRPLFLTFLFTVLVFIAKAQSLPTGQEIRYNPIPTAVPFLSISPDSRHGAMGDVGAATSVDANSQHWNPSKYAFAEEKFGIALSYTPWLRELVSDIDMAYLAGFYKIDNQQVLGASLRYFSMGEISLTNQDGTNLATVSPNEFAFDVSYSRKLSPNWSGGIAFRYIHSDLSGGIGNETYVPGNAFASDVSFTFKKGWEVWKKQKSISAGIDISNIGTKISYDEGHTKEFLPTNLRIGTTYFTQIEKLHSLAFSLDFNKLLVPTPSFVTVSPDGDNGTIVLPNNSSNESSIGGIFSSFSDAPGGFKEEMQEVNVSTGIEYWYNKQFALRGGYFNEHASKGNRKFISTGLGVKMRVCAIDLSYVIPTQRNSPLANTVRFTLLFDTNTFARQKEEVPAE